MTKQKQKKHFNSLFLLILSPGEKRRINNTVKEIQSSITGFSLAVKMTF